MNSDDMLIAKTVQLALEKGIIKSKSITVDASLHKIKICSKDSVKYSGTIKNCAGKY